MLPPSPGQTVKDAIHEGVTGTVIRYHRDCDHPDTLVRWDNGPYAGETDWVYFGTEVVTISLPVRRE
jgi:hypothetical protein